MESVTIKFNEDVMKKIDESIKKNNFTSRTEFLREAARDKLDSLDKKELLREFMKFHGKSKKKTSDKELEKIKEEAFEELRKEKGWR